MRSPAITVLAAVCLMSMAGVILQGAPHDFNAQHALEYTRKAVSFGPPAARFAGHPAVTGVYYCGDPLPRRHPGDRRFHRQHAEGRHPHAQSHRALPRKIG